MRRLSRIALISLVALGCLYVLASWEWCKSSPPPPPRLNHIHTASGDLKVGASAATMHPPLPIVVAGYPLPRTEVSQTALPLQARAIVLEVASSRVAIVSIDLLAISETLTEQVRQDVSELGFSQVWLLATHSHSSFGGYDPRPMAEAVGTGLFRKGAREAIVKAADSAIRRAAANLVAAKVEYGESLAPTLVLARSEGIPPDGRLGVLRFSSGGRVIGQIAFFGAHPTLVGRPQTALNPDYPGYFSDAEERGSGGVAMLLQTGLGNATPAIDYSGGDRAEKFAREFRSAVQGIAMRPISVRGLGLSRVTVSLPHPDGSRIVARPWLGLVNNVLCYSAPRQAEVSALQLGELTFVFVPAEATAGVVQRLRIASQANQIVSIANGYIGYIDTEDMLEQRQGESTRQYFGPALLGRLLEAAEIGTGPLRRQSTNGM